MYDEPRSRSESPGVTTSAAELVELCRSTPPPPGEARRRGAAHALSGPYLSRFRGGGIEFDEVRAYQPGDDVRSIDWRVTARTGRPHSRVFKEDREQPVWLLVDLGPDMHFGTRRAFKSVVAARATALLSSWANDAGDRVGGFVRGAETCAAHPPRSGQSRHLALMQSIAEATRVHQGESSVSFDDALAQLAEAVHPGSRVFVIGDFDALGPGGRRHLSLLARWCDLTCILVYDALEAIAPPPGEYLVHDGAHARAIAVGGRRAREAYRTVFRSRVEELRQLCRVHRIELVSLRTDEDPGSVLAEVVVARRPGR